MSQQVDIKLNGAKVNPNTVASAIYDAARDQALSASLINLIEKNALGFPAFSTLTAYAVGNKVFHDRKLWKFVQVHAAGAWNAQHVQEFSIKEYCDAIDEKVDINYNYLDNRKANIDGYYETMVVGAAKNLEGHNITEGTFFARPTGGEDAELANGLAQIQAVKGNSVKYNQLVQNGNFANGTTGWTAEQYRTISVVDGYLHCVSTSNQSSNNGIIQNMDIYTIVGHKYYMSCEARVSSAFVVGNIGFEMKISSSGVSKSFQDLTTSFARKSYIDTATGVNNRINISYHILAQGQYFDVKNIELVDLTALGIDNLTTAAQVEAWMAANWGAQEYYPNSAGAVLNVNMTGIESFKKNLLNPTTGKAYIIGAYSETYGNYYGICGTYGTLTFRDAYGNESTITPDADGKFELAVAGELTVADAGADCAVFLWWDGTETEYSEYGTSIAKLDITHIYGKLNGAGEIVRVWPTGMAGIGNIQDYLKIEDGAVVAKRVMQEIDLGTPDWEYQDENQRFKSTYLRNSKANTSKAICWKYKYGRDGNDDKRFFISSGNNVIVYDSSYTDAATFKTAMSGVMLYYELATPETYTDLVYMGSELFEDGTPVTLPVNYEADNWGIERVLPLNTSEAMVTSTPTIESKYSLDAVEQLDTHSAEIADLYNKNAIMDAKKANTDGSYETLVSGAAMNLVGRGSVGAEYRFRPTAGSGSVGSGAAKITKMLGNTLVWNQLVQNGNFANGTTGWTKGGGVDSYSASNNMLTVLAKNNTYNVIISQSMKTELNHKYYVSLFGKASETGNIRVGFSADIYLMRDESSLADFSFTTSLARFSRVITCTRNNYNYFDLRLDSAGMQSGFNWSVSNIWIVDLTLMFGAGNEPTAAQFETMYPLPYYAYNAGILINNEATGIKTVGFNLYNPTTGKAYVTGATGTADLTNGKNCYQITGAYTSITDAAGNAITPNEGGFFEVATAQELTVAGGDSTTCIHLTYSGYRNGEYEAYWENILALNLKTLTGKLNGKGESVIVRPNGLEAVGTTADEGIVEGGNLTKINVKIGNQVINGAIGDTITLEGCKTSATSFLCASDIGTLSGGVLTLTAAATNVEVYYPLAQPRTYILDTPVLVIYREDGYGTEERLPEDTDSAVTAPIKYEVEYPMDAVGILTDLPDTYVSGKEIQTFTTAEKAQARQNIGAASLADVQALFAALPTTDPQVAGELWNDNGTVKISAGE